MAVITQQHIHLLENKVKCSACKKVLFEGVIELGAISIKCPCCGNENTIFSLYPEHKKFSENSLVGKLRTIFNRDR